MNRLFSPLIDRDLKIWDIRLTAESGFEIFDDATYGLASSLDEELEEVSEKSKLARESLDEYLAKNPERIQDSSIYEDYLHSSHSKLWSLNDQLDSLAEMKIIYLFKHLESVIKHMFASAYYDQNVYDLYRVDNLHKTASSLGIDLKEIMGYNEFNQLRLVNNNIKHSKDIGDDVKRIMEFKKLTDFDNVSVSKFYNRVRPKVLEFSKGLAELVITNAFEFSDDRLKEISKSYLYRMDKDTALRFIDIFNRERENAHKEGLI